jgi:cytoskeletal protein RodZ
MQYLYQAKLAKSNVVLLIAIGILLIVLLGMVGIYWNYCAKGSDQEEIIPNSTTIPKTATEPIGTSGPSEIIGELEKIPIGTNPTASTETTLPTEEHSEQENINPFPIIPPSTENPSEETQSKENEEMPNGGDNGTEWA